MSIFSNSGLFYKPNDVLLINDGNSVTYSEARAIIYSIMAHIKKMNAKSVALNYRDQGKLFLCIWSALELGVDVYLLPALSKIEYDLLKQTEKIKIDLTLSDIDGFDAVDYRPSCEIVLPLKKMAGQSFFFLTSGTTGSSKLVRTTYYQLKAALTCLSQNKLMPYRSQQVVYISPPLFHSYGFSAMVEYVACGSTICVSKVAGLNSIKSLASLDSRVTAIEGVPYFYSQLLLIRNRLDLKNIQHIGFGGDNVTPDLLDKVLSAIPCSGVSIRYGLTEIPSVVAIQYFKPRRKKKYPKDLGKILPIYKTALKKIQHENEMIGELIIKHKYRALETKLIRTHDIFEKRGSKIFFKYRNFFIKVRGKRLSPSAIEELLRTHKDVLEARAYVLNDRLICDVIVVERSNLSTESLLSFLRNTHGTYYLPDVVKFVKNIERTNIGKIKR